MFGKATLTVIKFPVGSFGFVGSVPTALGFTVPANKSAVMGGRAFRDESGALVEWKFPTFGTEAEALEFAASKGFEAKVPVKA